MKKKYSALPELLLRSIFYTLINYVLLSMVLSFRLHWSSILFSAAMLWFALDYSKTIQQLTGKRLLARKIAADIAQNRHMCFYPADLPLSGFRKVQIFDRAHRATSR